MITRNISGNGIFISNKEFLKKTKAKKTLIHRIRKRHEIASQYNEERELRELDIQKNILKTKGVEESINNLFLCQWSGTGRDSKRLNVSENNKGKEEPQILCFEGTQYIKEHDFVTNNRNLKI